MPFSEAIKRKVKKRANFTCCWCQDRNRKVEIHHILPQASSGSDDIDNAAPLCGACHDSYGGNPDLRKEIRQRRDNWYELCAIDSSDANKSRDHETLASKIQPPVFRTMVPPAEGFVWRPEHDDLVRDLTREPSGDDKPETVAVTTALRGAGGFGKTTLAQALCEHKAVRERFPEGILWTTLGQKLTEADHIARIKDLLRWWTRKDPLPFERVETAAAELREALSGHRLLLVVDDVWLYSDLAPFTGIGTPATLLVTTRNTGALPSTAHQVVVDALELPGAIQLLGFGLSPLPPQTMLERLAARLGEWPILLKLVNAQLREEYRDGLSAEVAFRVVEDALDEVGLTAFDRENEEARNLAVRRTVEASLQNLSSQHRQYFSRLAVFPEDERAPLAILGLLWGVEQKETRRLCRRLAEMSLLYRFDPVGDWVQLHDVIRTYLQREHREDVPSFHGALVDALSPPPHSPEAESYFMSRLPYHLKESGREVDLEELLFSYPWLEEKVTATDVNAALADYGLLRDHKDAATVRDALILSRSLLAADSSQLAGQLHGRLAGSESARIRKLLAGALTTPTSSSRPWLRPLTATLQKPMGGLLFSIQAHQSEIRAIAELDARRFATAATDGKIHLWDFESGEPIATICGADNPIRHLASPAPNRLLAGSDDGIIRLWNLDEQRVIQSFEAHHSSITALCLRRQEFLSGSEDGALLYWSLDSEQPLNSFHGHLSRINGIGFLYPRTVISVAKDNTLRVWEFPSGRELKVCTLPPATFAAQALEVTAYNEVALGTWAGEIQIWKPLSEETVPRRFWLRAIGLDALCTLGRDLVVSNGGESAATNLNLLNPISGEPGPKLHAPGGKVTALARFGADHLLSGSKYGRLSVWAVHSLRAETFATVSAVFDVASVDATTAVSLSGQGSVHVWNVRDGTLLRTLEGHSKIDGSVCVLPRGRIASSSSSDQTIRIWNPHTGELITAMHCKMKPGALAAFSENFLISAPSILEDDLPIVIWDAATGQKRLDVLSIPGGVGALCATREYLLVGTFSNGLVVHIDILNFEAHRHFYLEGHEKSVVSLAAIDRSRIASGSHDTTIRIWDLCKREAVQVLRGHHEAVTGIACLSARFLASASKDQTIRIWDLDTGRPVARLDLDTGLGALDIMPDWRTLVAGDDAGTVHFIKVEGLSR